MGFHSAIRARVTRHVDCSALSKAIPHGKRRLDGKRRLNGPVLKHAILRYAGLRCSGLGFPQLGYADPVLVPYPFLARELSIACRMS